MFREDLCHSCRPVVEALQRFRHWFQHHIRDGILSPDEWHHLRQVAFAERVHFEEAVRFVQQDALVLLERTFAMLTADGIMTDEQRQYFHQLRQMLAIPPNLVQALTDRVEYLAKLSEIRRGKLPTVRPRARLDAGEICHLDVDAVFHQRTSRKTKEVPGRLVATNKKLRWISLTGGSVTGWNHVVAVESNGRFVILSLTKKALNGAYAVDDPFLVEAVLDTIARIDKREIVADGPTRQRIAQEVKVAVWQRDQGRCVQCSAHGPGANLQYDHMIPVAEGGSNDVGNIQLLCGTCNQRKGPRI
jgi:hypothetical protein